MKNKYTIYGRLNEVLGHVDAASEFEALALASLEWAYPVRALQVVPGGDHGVFGL